MGIVRDAVVLGGYWRILQREELGMAEPRRAKAAFY